MIRCVTRNLGLDSGSCAGLGVLCWTCDLVLDWCFLTFFSVAGVVNVRYDLGTEVTIGCFCVAFWLVCVKKRSCD